MDTEKPIALVTGATSGIGEACACRLHGAGYRVIITGRNTERLEALKADLGDDALMLTFDVRDREAAEAAIASLPAEWQEIEVLVNNAGLALGLEKEYEGDYRDWDTMIDTNIKGLLYMTRAVVPGMVARGKGHVVNIGSVAGDAAYANGNVYCGTKAAVKAITDGLRIDLAETPVRVTLLKPGLVETRFSEVRFHGDTERAANVYKGIVPLTGDDIADAALYAVQAPPHVQIAEMLILATHQASGSVICRK
ncbi:MAG: SDR family NAD(P)-dependent oxidoreductase [Muribaculaceae bacterium]|nr:SDR family NAD(P)-dependent oxidoreductase [Muribaculaceae bacterium]